MKQKIFIAGPCAVESSQQVDIAIKQARERGINFLRANLWKPRTKPGFEGIGSSGLPFLEKIIKNGLNPALEVLTTEQAHLVMKTATKYLNEDQKILLWIGARNQNHFIQKSIGRLVMNDERVLLMIKNQPWPSLDHWQGVIEHILSSGVPEKQLLNCHRGFFTHGQHNINGFRNLPDFDMAMRVQKNTNIPTLFDVSHTGGSIQNVFLAYKEALKYDFEGFMVEVHHEPQNALTDKHQQITWEQYDQLVAQAPL